MNTIFEKSVGGILVDPNLPVCHDAKCKYTLKINQSKVKVLNIESYLIEKIERLSIQHYEEYYDRVYSDNVVTTYELVYEPSMEKMDVSISLIPVTGSSGLFVNAKTLPTKLEKYDWQEKGSLAKRITVRWEELELMKAERSNLFIAVQTSKAGEFLLKMDAHDPGYRGRLNSGIIEAGFVNFEEISNYLYFFEVYQTQKLKFDVKLNVISGDADLYLKQCASFGECKIGKDDLVALELKAENNHSTKKIEHQFTCEKKTQHSASMCEFVIGVKGKQNHGTHFDLSLHESKFHRLMIPGNSMSLGLQADEVVYLKFSYPHHKFENQLFLQVDPLWGSFDLLMSKTQKYPSPELNDYKQMFQAQKAGLYQSMKTIAITTRLFPGASLQGVYYMTIKALSSCSLNLNFFEKSDSEVTVHTLTAGNQLRGDLSSQNEIQYYTIKLSLDDKQAGSVRVNLTPLKGDFNLLASKNGKLPTKDKHELFTQDNHLELPLDDNKAIEEYMIGVQLNTSTAQGAASYQYYIEFTYSNKPLKIKPGVLSSHTIKTENVFLIEIIEEMSDLLLLKSVVDGYNIKLCAHFTAATQQDTESVCQYEANEKKVSLYIPETALKSRCQEEAKDKTCFLQIRVTGSKNQKFTLGFTYNDHPFQLTQNAVVNGPALVDLSAKLNFIFHGEANKPISLYFNTKGRRMRIFTKLVRGEDFDGSMSLGFPSLADQDKEHVITRGHTTNVYYSDTKVGGYGADPELLISIRPVVGASNPLVFDPSSPFILQTTMGSQEILRTQTLSEVV